MKVARAHSRTKVLILSVAGLVAANLLWHLVFDWGRVTLHVDKAPLRKVIASIQSQGHIRLHSNLDPDTPVTMNLDDAPLTDALETLAVVTDSGWHLTYLVGPRKADLLAMLRDWEGGTKDDGWRWLSHGAPPIPGIAPDPDAAPEDPRGERVDFKPDEGVTDLQGLLDEVTIVADAQAVVAQDWNPALGAIKANASVGRLVAKLARAGKGTSYEVFLLSRRNRGPGPEVADGGDPQAVTPPSQNGRGNLLRMGKGVQARIDRLPAGQRAEAQARFDEMKAFFLSLRDLSPEDRRAKMEAMRNNPAFQDAMDDRQAARDAKMTPDQRDARAQRYVSNKAAVKGAH